MTRDDILRDYKVDSHGVIRRPGKFEGEMLYIPYFWEVGLDGLADDDIEVGNDNVEWIFEITDDDRAMFPELGKTTVLKLWESDQGFVYSEETEG